MKYKEGSSVSEHLSRFQDCVNRLSTMKMVLDEELQALILLSSLPDVWETFVVSLSNSALTGTVTLAMVKDSLLNKEMRGRELGITNEFSALVTENCGRSKHKSYHGHDNNDKSRGRSKSCKCITCYFCHRPSHMSYDCRKLKAKLEKSKDDQPNNKDSKNEKDCTVAVVRDGDVIIACDDDFVNFTSQDSTWIIDSAASFHVSFRYDLFNSCKEGDFGIVRMENDGVCEILGIGDVYVETIMECKPVLKDVRHTLDMRLQLISVGALDGDGYCSYFGDGKWKLSKDFLVTTHGEKKS